MNLHANNAILAVVALLCMLTGCASGNTTREQEDDATVSGCCQCPNSTCQDVSYAGQCRNICGPGGGNFHAGQSCVRNTCQ